jgi:hypothetical protein
LPSINSTKAIKERKNKKVNDAPKRKTLNTLKLF